MHCDEDASDPVELSVNERNTRGFIYHDAQPTRSLVDFEFDFATHGVWETVLFCLDTSCERDACTSQ